MSAIRRRNKLDGASYSPLTKLFYSMCARDAMCFSSRRPSTTGQRILGSILRGPTSGSGDASLRLTVNRRNQMDFQALSITLGGPWPPLGIWSLREKRTVT